jgi:hypothetical protein
MNSRNMVGFRLHAVLSPGYTPCGTTAILFFVLLTRTKTNKQKKSATLCELELHVHEVIPRDIVDIIAERELIENGKL